MIQLFGLVLISLAGGALTGGAVAYRWGCRVTEDAYTERARSHDEVQASLARDTWVQARRLASWPRPVSAMQMPPRDTGLPDETPAVALAEPAAPDDGPAVWGSGSRRTRRVGSWCVITAGRLIWASREVLARARRLRLRRGAAWLTDPLGIGAAVEAGLLALIPAPVGPVPELGAPAIQDGLREVDGWVNGDDTRGVQCACGAVYDGLWPEELVQARLGHRCAPAPAPDRAGGADEASTPAVHVGRVPMSTELPYPWRHLPAEPGLGVHDEEPPPPARGRHAAPEADDGRDPLTDTGVFWQLVGEALHDLADVDPMLALPCSHCEAPGPHDGCPGCACPCSLAVGVA